MPLLESQPQIQIRPPGGGRRGLPVLQGFQPQGKTSQIGALSQGGIGQLVEAGVTGPIDQAVGDRERRLQRTGQERVEPGPGHGEVVFRRGQAKGCPSDLDAGPHDVQPGHVPRFETDFGLAQDVPGKVEVLACMPEQRLLQGDPVVGVLGLHAHVELCRLEVGETGSLGLQAAGPQAMPPVQGGWKPLGDADRVLTMIVRTSQPGELFELELGIGRGPVQTRTGAGALPGVARRFHFRVALDNHAHGIASRQDFRLQVNPGNQPFGKMKHQQQEEIPEG